MQMSSTDKRPHFSSHGKRERESGGGGRGERGVAPLPPRAPLSLSQVALTALHKHAWIPTLPAGEEELLGQGEHEPLPAASLYVPTPHDTHAPPLGPVYPALHKHAWIPTLPAGEEELPGQGEHEALPAASLYVPAPHATHGPSSGPVYPCT